MSRPFVRAPGRIAPEWVDQRKLQWGETSTLYLNRVLGEFAVSDAQTVIPLAWVEAANLRWENLQASGEWSPFTLVAVDVARFGEDRTVLALRTGHAISELRRYARDETTATTGHVRGVLDAARRQGHAVVDVIGIGVGVVDQLREARYEVVSFNASERSLYLERSGELGYANRRAAAWWNLRELLDPGFYSRMLWPFFAATAPERVTPGDVLAYVHGIGRSGRTPSSTTVGARIACLSSFYRFLIRMRLLAANPCDALERPRAVTAPARGLSADEVRRLLAVVPDTVRGRRDRAIILVLVLIGRRRAEVMGLTAGDISIEDGTAFYAYRGKGGKRGRRELPRPAYEAVRATLGDAGLDVATMDQTGSLWQAGAGTRGISSGTFYGRFRRYLTMAGLSPTGLHVLRHTAAKLRRDAGESIEAVSAFLDHSSLAVTTVYLRRLEGQTDWAWPDVAAAIGV